MTGDGAIRHAVLVYEGARCFDPEALRRDIEAAYRATGEWAGVHDADDPLTVTGRTVCARFDVFAPIDEGGTVPVEDYRDGVAVFAEAYPDLPAPRALVSIQIRAQDPERPNAPRLSAVLGQVVDLFIVRTDADLVRLPECAGLMTAARFQAELGIATGRPKSAQAPDKAAAHDGEAQARGPRPRIAPEAFCDIDELEAQLDSAWTFGADGRGPETSGADTTDGTALIPVEARLATWAVSASVALLAPPVGASLAVYNLLRGEDFRLSAHALALTGTFLALGASGAPLPSIGGLL